MVCVVWAFCFCFFFVLDIYRYKVGGLDWKVVSGLGSVLLLFVFFWGGGDSGGLDGGVGRC